MKTTIARQLKYLTALQTLASSHKGQCLSKKYVNSATRIRWQCKEGHVWSALPSTVAGGWWCLKCARAERNIIKITKMQVLAKEHGGKCLSKNYSGGLLLEWECKKKHTWKSSAELVKKGKWCQKCKTEQRKEDFFQEVKQIAIEHDGKCLSKKLISGAIKLDWQCHKGHTWKATPYSIKNGIWCPVCSNTRKERSLVEMQNIAAKRGGKCLSDAYVDHKTNLTWQCKEKHVWQAKPYFIKQGNWCKICALNERRNGHMIEMQEIAAAHEGKCLSLKYINNKTKLKWQCKEGHTWMAIPFNVKTKTWCPQCWANRDNNSIEKMQAVAAEKGGKCLSKRYINAGTRMKWECKDGHTWKTTYSLIKQGKWCPKCSLKNRSNSIEEMQQIAESRGGKCLSTEYTNNKINLKWQCKEGHTWMATPYNVKRKTWCPMCQSEKRYLRVLEKNEANKKRLSLN